MRFGHTIMFRLCQALAVSSLIGVAGCRNEPSQKDDVLQRLQHTIRELEEHARDSKVLPLLRRATPETLNTPALAYVSVFEQPKSLRLWLEWIEARPTPDAIRISNYETDYEKTLPFDLLYTGENAKMSKSSVLFGYVHAFDADSDEWQELRKSIAGGEALAVLLRRGEAVSNTVPVKLFEASQ